MRKCLLLALVLIVSGCRPAGITLTTQTSTFTPTTRPIESATPETTVTATQGPTSKPDLPTGTQIPFQVCSPLEEETIESLPLILVNPLVIPPFGKDDGHHGLDFAYYRRGERESIQGIEIYAILSGKTVLTLEDNIPYGYTILIETPLANLPQSLQGTLLSGYLPIPEEVVYQGECPEFTPPTLTKEMSIFHLYAHMETRPSFKPGDTIPCGTKLGTVGNTGYSSNPHLHLETRLGPSGADFESMAFYNAAYSPDQRATYCLWRMSGYYQLFDPFLILNAAD